MEAAQLGWAFLALAVSGCEARQAPLGPPSPRGAEVSEIWIARDSENERDRWAAVFGPSDDAEQRKFRATKDVESLGLGEGSAVLDLFLCNFSAANPVQLPMNWSSEGGKIRSLPEKSPSKPTDAAIWRALGGGVAIRLEPRAVVKIGALGKLGEPLPAEFRLDLGDIRFRFSRRTATPEEIEELRRGPRRESLEKIWERKS